MARINPKAYDTLLRVRQRQEDLRAQALAAARREVNMAMAQRDDIAREQLHMLAVADERLRSEFDAADVRRFYQHERHLARLGVEKDSEIRELEAIAEERRGALEAASKSRRIVERLQERKHAAYSKHVRKIEQQQIDESATAYAALGITPGDRRVRGLNTERET